jgi:uncharacterized repeat protein (TIGR01451 family)
MKGIHGLTGLVMLSMAFAAGMVPAGAQSTDSQPPAENPAPPPTLDPLPLPVAPTSNAAPLEGKPTLKAAPTKSGELFTGRQEPAVSLEWLGSPQAKVGRPTDYTLAVRNVSNSPVQQVLVRVQLPPGTRAIETEPQANLEGEVLWWDLGLLVAKQEKNLRLRLVADGKGNLACNAWVTFTGTSALRIQVSEPRLVLKMTPPTKVMLGDNANVQFTVTNPGDGVAEKVRLHAVLSEGLEHPSGRTIEFDMGNLAPKESRTVQLFCATKAGGEQKCEGTAEAKGDLRAKDRCLINVVMPRLDLAVSGPKLRYIDRKAVYSFKVTNPGDGPATNVTVTDVIPAGFKFTSASDGGRPDPTLHTVSWFIGDLAPAQTKEVKLEVVATNPGDQHHQVTAQAAHGIKVNNNIQTRVEGTSSLLLEVVDTEDPIEVGAETSYEIRITNTGSKTETDIKLVGILPDKMKFKTATGPTRFREKGKEIAFEPLPKLEPKADAIYRITVRAMAPGDVRFKAQITSASLAEPVIEMESTRIYQD